MPDFDYMFQNPNILLVVKRMNFLNRVCKRRFVCYSGLETNLVDNDDLFKYTSNGWTGANIIILSWCFLPEVKSTCVNMELNGFLLLFNVRMNLTLPRFKWCITSYVCYHTFQNVIFVVLSGKICKTRWIL